MSQPFREIVKTASFAVSGTLTAAIDIGWADKGFVEMPVAWTAANLGFQVSQDATNFYILRTGTATTPIQIGGITTDAIRAYPIPSEVFNARYVKLWSKSGTAATETDVKQAGARSLKVYLKE